MFSFLSFYILRTIIIETNSHSHSCQCVCQNHVFAARRSFWKLARCNKEIGYCFKVFAKKLITTREKNNCKRKCRMKWAAAIGKTCRAYAYEYFSVFVQCKCDVFLLSRHRYRSFWLAYQFCLIERASRKESYEYMCAKNGWRRQRRRHHCCFLLSELFLTSIF